jgi:hypothetical protein
LKSFRAGPPASWHLDLWFRLSRLTDALSIPPKRVPSPEGAKLRRSPTFSARYELDGRVYRTEVWATPSIACFEVGPHHDTARSHEGGGFEIPIDEVLAPAGLRDTRGEPRDVMDDLSCRLRAWFESRVDPAWRK